tara:strand:+ start:626 stop:1987 length:1362 start_codon:yes stop_codon:yes gene_type:complete
LHQEHKKNEHYKMSSLLKNIIKEVEALNFESEPDLAGFIKKYDGTIAEATAFPVTVGTVCAIQLECGGEAQAEVIGFREGNTLLAMHDLAAPIKPSARVVPSKEGQSFAVGSGCLGRVINAYGLPLDDLANIEDNITWPARGKISNPLASADISESLDVGVRAINGLFTVGVGQRMGIIAGSGVGKSTLLGMMARFTSAEVVVVGLIGERAREVRSFVNDVITPATKDRTVVVAEPAGSAPLLRIRAALRATAIAEYFREKGKNVLLIMDSLTRVAHAQREIGLALGEQATTKGYPPSVMAMISQLVERTGLGPAGKGSITAFYTVLADGDDVSDPVVDSARAILDGHIVLSRKQAEMGIYPAIDIAASVSRVMPKIVGDTQLEAAVSFKRAMSVYMENRDLIMMGGYRAGADNAVDRAIELLPKLTSFQMQNDMNPASLDESNQRLLQVFNA